VAGGRFDIVEQGQRGRRWIGMVVLLALVAVPLAGIFAGRGRDLLEPIVTPVPVRSTINVTANAVYPSAKGNGGTRTIPVAFPDGLTAEIRYPAELNLAALGVRPYTSGTLAGDGKMDEFRSLTAPMLGEAEVAAGRPMIRQLTAKVTLWPGPLGVDALGPVLLFSFGDWRIALQDEREGMTFEQRLAWARNLHGRVTRDGFLALSATGPVRLSRPGEIRDGVLVGPQVWIGGVSRRMVVLAPIPDCTRHGRVPVVIDQRHAISGDACRGGFYLAASGDQDFVRRVLKDVHVRPV
jgi:hypothetical protein